MKPSEALQILVDAVEEIDLVELAMNNDYDDATVSLTIIPAQPASGFLDFEWMMEDEEEGEPTSDYYSFRVTVEKMV